MTTAARSKTLHIILWVVQILLAAGFIFGGATKLFTPIEQLQAQWPWTGEVPPWVVKGTGVLDLVGALGLLLPMSLRIKPILTPIAAICLIVQMIAAIIFHLSRGESNIEINTAFAVMAAFIAWGRVKIGTK